MSLRKTFSRNSITRSTEMKMLSDQKRALGGSGLAGSPYVTAVAVFASLGGLLFGYDQGVISNVIVMENFGSHFPRIYTDANIKGWVVSVLELGAWLGALLMGYFAEKLGRRRSIILAVFFFCIGTALQTGAENEGYLFSGRFIGGIAIGMLAMVVPAYQGEIAPAEIRGALTALQQFSITIGILIAFWLSYGTHFIGGIHCKTVDFSQTTVDCPGFGTLAPAYCAHKIGCGGQHQGAWRVPLGVQLVPALVLAIGILFFPESPRWLMNKGREEEARAVLSKLRRVPEDDYLLDLEFRQIKASILLDKENERERFPQYMDGSRKSNFLLGANKYWSLLVIRPFFHRVALGSIINFFQQFTGINAIIYYAPTIFASLGLSGQTTSILATGVVGIVNVIFTIPAILFLDKWGRRKILILGAVGMFITMIIEMSLNIAYEDSWTSHKGAGWAAAAMIWLFIACFAWSWGPLGWVYPSDIMPASIRSEALAITTSSNWMNNFIIGQITPRMIQHLRWGTYLFFACFIALSIVFVFFFIVETKGKSIEELDTVFHDSTAHQDHERLMRINKELGLEADGNGVKEITGGNGGDEKRFSSNEKDKGEATKEDKAEEGRTEDIQA